MSSLKSEFELVSVKRMSGASAALLELAPNRIGYSLEEVSREVLNHLWVLETGKTELGFISKYQHRASAPSHLTRQSLDDGGSTYSAQGLTLSLFCPIL